MISACARALRPVSTGSPAQSGSVLGDCRVLDRPETDSLALDVVTGERETPDAENDYGNAEEDQQASGDVAADS